MRKIIFLDIDGVLNHEEFFHKQKHKKVKYKNRNDWFAYSYFDIECLKRIEKLCKKHKAEIVLSATARFDFSIGEWNDFFKFYFHIEIPIIGVTPSLKHGFRGLEIKDWLSNQGFNHINWNEEVQYEYMEKSNIQNYIILDDDSDMTYTQRNHFVHVLPSPRHIKGFDEYYYNKADEILSKDIITLNYN